MEVKGILHCHSRYSYDGKLSLPELRELLLKEGLHFVCMTEHTDELSKEQAEAFIAECDALSDERFRFIPGFEVPYKHAHILMIGMRGFYERYAPTIDALMPWMDEASFVVLAHPVRNGFMVEDALLDKLDALEVWNQQYEGKRVPRVRSLVLYSLLKHKKPSLIALGGVDLHRKEHIGSPVIALSVERNDEKEILEKLKMGAFSVSSPQSRFFGSLPNPLEVARTHRWESHLSVLVIVVGKFVNKVLKSLGLSFPASFKQLVRRRL